MITEEQKLARMNGIGGSDAPIILGMSPYKSIVQLWMEKTGQAAQPDLSDVEAVIFGNLLEDVVAKEFERRTGIKVRRVNETIIDRKESFLLANIDRRVVGEPSVVEIKTVRGLDADQPRADHIAQLQHYMHVGNFNKGWLVYLISGQRLVWFEVSRNQDAIEQMLIAERAFWNCVQTNTAPKANSAFDLKLLHSQDNGTSVLASDEIHAAVTRLSDYKKQIKEIESAIEQDEKIVFDCMGDSSALLSNTGSIIATWKTSKPQSSFLRAKFEADHPDLAKTYITEKPGSRRFLIKESSEL